MWPAGPRLISSSPSLPAPVLLRPAKRSVCAMESGITNQTQLVVFIVGPLPPLGLVTAARHVMLSFSLPRHAPSQLVDGNIILGGMAKVEGEHLKQPEGTHGSEGVAR